MGSAFATSVRCTLASWLKDAPDWVRRYPLLLRVELTDRSPREVVLGRCYFGFLSEAETEARTPAVLPEAVFSHLAGNPWYGTRAEAEDALSDALLVWARDEVR